jgi:MoxR-like ATPase
MEKIKMAFGKGKGVVGTDVKRDLVTVDDIKRTWDQMRAQLKKVIIGKLDVLELLFTALLVNGHVYLEGVPGIAKTWITNNFAGTLGCEWSRIQFTPDMLPADIVGTNIFNPKTGTFNLKKGPIFGNIILADEINRAPPKTQSALLEAMAEKQVTIEGETYKLPSPFIVIATANPVEQEGTYPLPEAQVDRFLIKLIVDYPTPDEELGVIKLKHNPVPASVDVVTSPEGIRAMQKVSKQVQVHDDLLEYMRDVIVKSRGDPRLVLGGSPRASMALLDSSKARAAIRGREYVIPDDVKAMIPHTVHHRLIMKPEAELEGISKHRIAADIMNELQVPV